MTTIPELDVDLYSDDTLANTRARYRAMRVVASSAALRTASSFSGKRRRAAYFRGELEILAVEQAHHRLCDVVGLNEE